MMGWLTLKALGAVIPGNEKVPGIAASTRSDRGGWLRRDAPFEMRMVLNLAVLIWLSHHFYRLCATACGVVAGAEARTPTAHQHRSTWCGRFAGSNRSLGGLGARSRGAAAYGMKPCRRSEGCHDAPSL